MNSTLCDAIRAFSTATGSTWNETVSAVLFAYRNTLHAGISNTPAMLAFGRNLRSTMDAELDSSLHDS